MADEIDPTRRRMLLRLGLATTAIYAAPVLATLSTARASSFSVSSSAPRRVRRQPARRARRAPPEIVVAALGADIDRIAADGYALLSRDSLALLGREIARFALPANVGIDLARQRILELAPQALFDLNHVYTPGELACSGGDCAAFTMIGWQARSHPCLTEITVGLVDTPVNVGHAALADVDIDAFPVIAEGRAPGSAVHGTAIAILLGGRRDTRTPGLLVGARILAAEAFHRGAGGQDAADAFDVARAVDRLVARGASVINLSFAGPRNALLGEVVRAAIDAGAILVAAAGNEGARAEPLYPAAHDGVVAVTAIDGSGRVYRQANAGDHIDFAAPGVRLWTAASVSGGRYRSGTSFAAPFVTAALAIARARAPEADGATLIEQLAASAVDLGDPGRDATYGWGLVQSPGRCEA